MKKRGVSSTRKLVLKAGNKIKKKAGVRHSKVVLTPRQARIKQDLGNGFTRYVFHNTIPANASRDYTFSFPEKVINGGWWIENNFSPAYATSSYAYRTNIWVIVLHNPTSRARMLTFTIITKR